MKTITFAWAAAVILLLPLPAMAQLGKLLREGTEGALKRAHRAMNTTADDGAEVLGSKALSQSLAGGAETAVRRVANEAAVPDIMSVKSVFALTRHGELARPVIATFGDQGASALRGLSPNGARQLVDLTPDLAAHPRGADWLKVIAEKGDEAVEWLWTRKGSLAVGTTATAALLAPEQFLEASEAAVTTMISVGGEHVARPLITETVSAVGAPIAQEAARVVGRESLWSLLLTFGFFAGVAAFAFRSWRQLRQSTVR